MLICLERYPNDVDIISPSERLERFGIRSNNDLSKLLLKNNEPIDDIYRLIKTPRLLKVIFRKTFRTWESLHGELDFTDLFIANVIRFSAPEAFNFILNNIQEIRGLEFDFKYQEDHSKRLEAVEAKWIRATKEVDWDVTSANKLIKFLFPYWGKSSNSVERNSFQQIFVNSPTDYWSRFLIEELAADEIRDQVVIGCLIDWQEKQNKPHFMGLTLPAILCTNLEFSEKFEYFTPFLNFNGTELRELASALFVEAIVRNGINASCDVVPGFIPLWRRVIRQPIEEERHLLWVLDEVVEALPKSFRFAIDIYYYFNSNSQSDVERKQHHVDLWRKIVLKAKEIFSGKPEKFLQSIDPKYIYSSYHFCFYLNGLNQGELPFKPEELKWFANLLLEAGYLNPQAIIPQIAVIVVKENHHIRGFSYNFDWDRTDEFFKGENLRLMKLLSIKIDLNYFSSREVELLKCAKSTAEEWLEQEKN